MEFQILKTINNNIVSCLDPQGREHILMGRGLGFGRKAGQTIGQDQVEKIFSITDEANLERFKELLSRLPRRQVEFCTELIPYACDVLGHSLNESVCYTLCDHICFAIERVKNGMAFTNALHTEVRLFYPREYGVGSYAVSEIARRFQVQLPEDEAGSIAMHIVNAEFDYENTNDAVRMTELVHKIISVVRYQYHMNFNEESLHFGRFVTHLKFFAQRLFQDKMLDGDDGELSSLIRTQYADSYACAEKIAKLVWNDYQIAVPEEELVYLAVYIRRITAANDDKE